VRRSRPGEPSGSGARKKGGQSDTGVVMLGHRWWEKEGRSERVRGGKQHDLIPAKAAAGSLRARRTPVS
jgi:hypothetical protein